MFLQQFWGHGETGSEDSSCHFFLLQLLGKPEISYLADPLMKEDVGYFKVSVHGVDFVQPFEAIDDLFEKGSRLIFSEALLEF